MHAILIKPKETLSERPNISEVLLEEVLSSDLLCLSDEELLDLLVKWKDTEEGCSKVQLIERHVSLANVSAQKIRTLATFFQQPQLDHLKSLKPKKARSLHAEDVLRKLKNIFDDNASDPTEIKFVSNWVNVIHSKEAVFKNGLYALASRRYEELLAPGNWVE